MLLQGPNPRLLISLLEQYLDESVARAIELTNIVGCKYIREVFIPKKLNFSCYQPHLSLLENKAFVASTSLEEAAHLLKSESEIMEKAKKVRHILFNSSTKGSQYTFEHNARKLGGYFKQLKAHHDAQRIDPLLLDKINTLIALFQVHMMNEVVLSYITRLTDEFCVTVQAVCPNKMKKLTLSSSHLCIISKELQQFSELTEFTVSSGKSIRLPPEIGFCQNLTRISVMNTTMRHLPHTLKHLRNLEVLNVNGNQLVQLLPSLVQCPKLQLINAYGNPQMNLPKELASENITINLVDPFEEFDSQELEKDITERLERLGM